MAVGVPEMTPVDVFSVNPVGNAGVTKYDVTAPPETVGLSGVIAFPIVNTFGEV